MSDNFYFMELMVREKARWAEVEMQRRQMLARVPRSDAPGPGRFFAAVSRCGPDACRSFWAASRKCLGWLMPLSRKGL